MCDRLSEVRSPYPLGRLVRGAEIRRAIRAGRTYGSDAGVLSVTRTGGSRHRLCVAASRQVGKACVRNRVRRRVREIIRREIRGDVSPVDLVFRVRPCASDMDFWPLHAAVTRLLARCDLLARPDSSQWR